MALDWPSFGDALWRVSDQLGIRPEWQLPVLYLESRFNPASTNPDGCVGLNQLCPGTFAKYVSVPTDQYKTWTASEQLSGPIFNYWRDALESGPIRSSTRLMLSQLGQTLLGTKPALDSVVYAAPNAAYRENAHVFDSASKGYYTVQDIAHVMAQQAQTPAVLDALSRVYAMRPGDRPLDPVYGEDYALNPRELNPGSWNIRIPSSKGSVVATALGVVVLVSLTGFGVYKLTRNNQPLPEAPWPTS